MSTTPMMKQYDAAKKSCGDALLLFRMGDFYELFHDDAKVAARILGLALTSRDKSANPVPMAGFPHHQLDAYMAKLIAQGHRVAVCDQVEDAQQAKGLVRREVTQVVTPGTISDQELLDPAKNNYLVSVLPWTENKRPKEARSSWGVSWADCSTGLFCVTTVGSKQLGDLLARLHASEILVPPKQRELISELVPAGTMITERPAWCFGISTNTDLLKRHFQVASLDGFGVDEFGPAAIGAAGAVIEYLQETQKASLEHFDVMIPYRQSQFVEIDSASWRSLEVSQTIRGGDRNGSLLGVMDRSVTPMGSRLLGQWLANPLAHRDSIVQRHDAVSELVEDASLRKGLRNYLGQVHDLQRLLGRVSVGRSSPRDLACIEKTLSTLPDLKQQLNGRGSQLLQQLELDLDPCLELQQKLESALDERCPTHTREGGYLKSGYDVRLDEMRELAAGGKQWIASYQQTICDQTGIPSLKVGFNKVFGYYLEVTHVHRDKVPQEFIRKQTLKNAERFITPELKEYEEKVLAADNQADELEMRLFEELRECVRTQTLRLKSNAQIIAQIDTLCALAELATEQKYCRPVMVDDSILRVVDGRHPVLDIIEPLGAFVPNDTTIDEDAGILHLITGPNMAGKSTYIRQVALISLLAQIGSFVPAKSATLGLVDKIFARVGASDELTRGQSTFMVEMTETARILNTATPRSLVILDEIGRGTSTYDGVSLAWAIVEFLHDQIGCRTLFATHYHELTELESELNGVSNYNVAVKEWDEKIVFLHKIVPGGADQSYGIHVAQLAGVPKWVNQRADNILEKLESGPEDEKNRNNLKSNPGSATGEIQMTLFGLPTHPLVDKIKALDPNSLTPLHALEMLHQWQEDLSEEQVER